MRNLRPSNTDSILASFRLASCITGMVFRTGEDIVGERRCVVMREECALESFGSIFCRRLYPPLKSTALDPAQNQPQSNSSAMHRSYHHHEHGHDFVEVNSAYSDATDYAVKLDDYPSPLGFAS